MTTGLPVCLLFTGSEAWKSTDLSIGEILVSVLPEEFHDDIPTGFNTAGHVGMLPHFTSLQVVVHKLMKE